MPAHACHDFTAPLSRRDALRTAAGGFGAVALAGLTTELAAAEADPFGVARPHHAARAKRVIFLFMHGGPSQVDTFDPKPRLARDDGKPLPFDAAPNTEAANDGKATLLASPWRFTRHGASGLPVSSLLPETAKHADELCVLRGMHSRGQSHGQAVCMLHTGSDNLPRPSVGAWVSYGLGGENRDLPSFVSLAPPPGHGGPRNYGTAFLPAQHQATAIGRGGKLGSGTIDFLEPVGPAPHTESRLELLAELNAAHAARTADPRVEGVIRAHELAFRMRGVAPRVLDLSDEPDHVHREYGTDLKETAEFGRQCLLARRLCEAGVRYVQVSTGYVWDQHGKLREGHEKNARATDRPTAALLTDLKRRGLLDDTLVIWGGEFGRTPVVQGKDGRDHNPQGFTMWLAGGGVRGGTTHGETDEYGYYAVADRTHMHDLHATTLHLLGLDHERLTYRHAGRDFRLTDVAGRVVTEILA